MLGGISDSCGNYNFYRFTCSFKHCGYGCWCHTFSAWDKWIEEGIVNIKNGSEGHVGKIKEGYINTARFMGFDEKFGALAYSSMDLSLSAYGMARFVLKPDARRLFNFLPSDYIRNVKRMSVPSLLIEGTGDAINIKTALEE